MLRGLPRSAGENAVFAVLDSIIMYIGSVARVRVEGSSATIDMDKEQGAQMLAMYGNLEVDGCTCTLEPCFKIDKPQEQQSRRNSDWICMQCNTMNFARRQECFQCQASRLGNAVAVEDTAPRIDPRVHHKERETTLLVRDIPDHATEHHVRTAFNPFGQLYEVRYLPDRHLAFVEFENPNHLQMAMRQAEDRGIRVDGTYVAVTIAQNRDNPRGGVANAAIEQAMAMAQARSGKKGRNDASEEAVMGAPQSNFRLDPVTGFYFNEETQQYYDEKTGVYYTQKDGKYYYFDPTKSDYVECAAIGSTLPPDAGKVGGAASAVESKSVVAVPKAKKKKAGMLAMGVKKGLDAVKINASIGQSTGATKAPAAALADFKFEVINFNKKKDPTPPTSPALAAATAGVAVSAICYLCNRKFASQEMLKKHNELSVLHKENLAKAAAKERERRAAQ